MKKNIYIILLLSVFIVTSCNYNKNKLEKDISKVKGVDVKINRYEKFLFNVDINNLKQELHSNAKNFGFFLNGDLNDTLNLIQIREYITDPGIVTIYKSCIKKYPNLNDLEKQLTLAFKHYKYYFSDKKMPGVYTYISGLEYESPIIFADTVLIISLDLYLGKNSKFYSVTGIPLYKRYRMQREFIVSDCMKEIAKANISANSADRTFLDKIIYKGKILYFVDAMTSNTPDSIKIGYTWSQLEWVKKNEPNIWAFFINKEVLYSTDKKVFDKFISDGPFTSSFSQDSPSRTGCWIGWQIVRSYMKNNKQVSLKNLMSENDAQKILTKSGYKPR
jgi:gliding motility-associated lipoprotein GldB